MYMYKLESLQMPNLENSTCTTCLVQNLYFKEVIKIQLIHNIEYVYTYMRTLLRSLFSKNMHMLNLIYM